jgi:hypothetical protein
LGSAALTAINDALAAGQLAVATISFCEVAMLKEKCRLMMSITTVRKIFFFTGENLNTSHRPENPLLGFLLL